MTLYTFLGWVAALAIFGYFGLLLIGTAYSRVKQLAYTLGIITFLLPVGFAAAGLWWLAGGKNAGEEIMILPFILLLFAFVALYPAGWVSERFANFFGVTL